MSSESVIQCIAGSTFDAYRLHIVSHVLQTCLESVCQPMSAIKVCSFFFNFSILAEATQSIYVFLFKV